jgi:hypothetical protein
MNCLNQQQQQPSMSSVSLPDQAEHIKEQCVRRESLRRSLDEDRHRLTSLRQKVERLQEELTKEKQLLDINNLPRREAIQQQQQQQPAVRFPHHPLQRQQAVNDNFLPTTKIDPINSFFVLFAPRLLIWNISEAKSATWKWTANGCTKSFSSVKTTTTAIHHRLHRLLTRLLARQLSTTEQLLLHWCPP